MNAVGKLHRIGVKSRIRIARPYPAPCTMSSVPYVPPDTMKKVAATSGHNVSFALVCCAVGIARAGSWAGNEIVLNSYSRPPQTKLALIAAEKPVRIRRIQDLHLHASRK